VRIEYIDFTEHNNTTDITGFIISISGHIADMYCAIKLNITYDTYKEILMNLGAIETRSGLMFLKKEQAESAVVTLKLMK
jgi:hypothetical protein